MSPLVTQHDITVSIDGESFEITVSEVNKKARELQRAFERKHGNPEIEVLEIQTALRMMNEEYQLNATMIANGKDSISHEEVSKLCKEQKRLLDERKMLNKKVRDFQQKQESLEDETESYWAHVFSLMVTGKDAQKLIEYIEKNGMYFSRTYKYIQKELQRQIEKK